MATPSKPDYIFDREQEWEGLASFATSSSPDARLGVVSGRRRQGKTYLLDALVNEVGGFFYAATEATEAESLARFGEALASHTGGGRYAFANWEEALARLFEAVTQGVIVIDELPYLSMASPSLPSLLQHALDPRGALRRSDARLLICGSAMSIMGKLLAGGPLRGRASLDLVVRPLDYRTAARFWGLDDWELAVLVHSIVGGTPAYRREFVAGDSPSSLEDFDGWVLRTALNPQVPLFREARYILTEEATIRDPAGYHAVLNAIAAGHRTRGGIANHIGRPSSDIGHSLSVLEDAQLIAKHIDPFRQGRAVYRVSEPLLAFYEAIVRRHWTQLERGDAQGAWESSRATFLSQVVGPHFEEICREWALAADPHVFGDLPAEAAAATVNDPANRTQIQVDVAVLAPEDPQQPRRVLSLGEAKWGRIMTPGHLERLRRARDLLAVKGFDTSEAVLACYSGQGFDTNLQQAAAQDEHVLLVGLDDLYGR